MATPQQHFCRFLCVLFLAITPLAAQQPSPNVRLGMPTPATTDPSRREDYLIERPQYTLSYNAKTDSPNWVCWRLRAADIGKAQRGPFKPDNLPKGFTRATSHAYDNSGFDRGHMCPAQDRSSSQHDIDATFYLTNVVPQSPASNQQGWERLESYCRDLAKRGHVLYIACGPHGIGGTGKDGLKTEIGAGRVRVTVPAMLWKVILVLPDEGAEPDKRTRVIAVIMPNDQTVGFDWARYRVSIADVERLTGYKFFPALPDDIVCTLKYKVDDVAIRAPVSGNSGRNRAKKEHE